MAMATEAPVVSLFILMLYIQVITFSVMFPGLKQYLAEDEFYIIIFFQNRLLNCVILRELVLGILLVFLYFLIFFRRSI